MTSLGEQRTRYPAPGDQPPPVHRPGEPSVHEQVRDWLQQHADINITFLAVAGDLMERAAVGVQRYGTPLQCGNGRDALWDAYQEALDALAYTGQAHFEQTQADPHGLATAGTLAAFHVAIALCETLRRVLDRRAEVTSG